LADFVVHNKTFLFPARKSANFLDSDFLTCFRREKSWAISGRCKIVLLLPIAFFTFVQFVDVYVLFCIYVCFMH